MRIKKNDKNIFFFITLFFGTKRQAIIMTIIQYYCYFNIFLIIIEYHGIDKTANFLCFRLILRPTLLKQSFFAAFSLPSLSQQKLVHFDCLGASINTTVNMATIMIPSARHAAPLPTRTDDNGGVQEDTFDSTFVTTEVTLDDTVLTTPDDFDPFHIGDASKHNLRRIPPPSNNTTKNPSSSLNKSMSTSHSNNIKTAGPVKSTISTNGDNDSVHSETGSKSTSSRLIPPRMLVKFKIHEEVSSVASLSTENEGASDVFVEGTIMVGKRSSSVGEFGAVQNAAS